MLKIIKCQELILEKLYNCPKFYVDPQIAEIFSLSREYKCSFYCSLTVCNKSPGQFLSFADIWHVMRQGRKTLKLAIHFFPRCEWTPMCWLHWSIMSCRGDNFEKKGLDGCNDSASLTTALLCTSLLLPNIFFLPYFLVWFLKFTHLIDLEFLIHSFTKYVLSTYYVVSIHLGPRDSGKKSCL